MRQIRNRPRPLSRQVALLLLASAVCLVAGCGKKPGKQFPVEGKIFLDSIPLKSGRIVFIPDAAGGNQTTFRPAGTIDAQGVYRVESEHGKGAPAGAYKVTVNTGLPTATDPSPVQIPLQYSDATKTDLKVVVAENAAPGAYDLQLKK